MASYGEIDPDLKEAALRDSAVDELMSLLGETSCAGCPIIEGIINSEGSRIDTLRKAAADKDFFDKAVETAEELPDGQMGIRILGVEGVAFVIPSFGSDGAQENTGTIFNAMLDTADMLEGNIKKIVKEKTSSCPGTLELRGHDQKTRQLYGVTICSEPETNQLTNGLVLSRVELEPDV